MELSDLPALNAILNSTATVLLISGLVFIKRGNKKAHVACMISALVVSAAFLTSYLIYHYNHPTTKFAHAGVPKMIYFFILATHVPLAMINLPMIIMTVVPALRQRFDRHKQVARWTYPIWLYVSVTGVMVYLMLYHWYPAA